VLQSQGRVWFDRDRCQRGIDCLENYHRAYKDKLETFAEKPEHDWASHGADAFRYLVWAYRNHIVVGGIRPGVPDPLVPGHLHRQDPYRDWHVLGRGRRRV